MCLLLYVKDKVFFFLNSPPFCQQTANEDRQQEMGGFQSLCLLERNTSGFSELAEADMQNE